MGKIGVTGTSGYVGGLIARLLEAAGFEVVRFERKAVNSDIRVYDLNCLADNLLIDDISVMIHCAYDFRSRGREEVFKTNVDGSSNLAKVCCEKSVKFIFISSVSAFDESASIYGQAKRESEKVVLNLGGFVIRPGLVFSNRSGGMIGALERVIKFPVIPIVSGDTPLYVTDVDGLVTIIQKIIQLERPLSRPVVAVYRYPYSFRGLLISLAARNNRKPPILIPVPSKFVLMFLRCLEALGFRPKLRSDSLISLLNPNRKVEIIDSWTDCFRSL